MDSDFEKAGLKTIAPENQEDWDERLVRSGKSYSFFHSSAWASVLRDAYGYSPCYFVAGNGPGFSVLVPMMEVKSLLTRNRGVSLPFSDYCDALFDDAFAWPPILDAIAAYGRDAGWRYLEFRGQGGIAAEEAFTHFYSHRLELETDTDRLFAGMDSAVRRNIRKAMKEGVTVESCSSLESVRKFYQLNCLTRKEHGLPSQPYSFFKRIHQHIISRDKGFVMLASLRREPIAAAVFFHIGDRVIFKYGASDRQWQQLRANNLLMWEAIRWSARAGFRSFCFGRTEPDNEGLRRFKSGWGAREGLIRYYRYDIERRTFIRNPPREMDLQRRLFRRLPVPVLNLIGNLSYRHMG